MKRWKAWSLSFLVVSLVTVIVGLSVYIGLSSQNEDYYEVYQERAESGEIINPIKKTITDGDPTTEEPAEEFLTTEDAIEEFDEDYVHHVLFSIKAYNLHEAFLSSDTPKLEFYIDGKIYSAFVEEGEIFVSTGGVEDEDVIIRTTKEEVIKMLKDPNYVADSFRDELSTIELKSGRLELIVKGYLELYEEITGEGFTGFVIKNWFN